MAMQTQVYLNFDGHCAEAFRFYEKTLKGKKLELMTFADSKMTEGLKPAEHDQIMHARLKVGSTLVMGSDAPGGRYRAPQGFSVSLTLDTPAEATRIFKAFTKGGSVAMPIQKTFWAKRFGMVTDRFGIPWMINCE